MSEPIDLKLSVLQSPEVSRQSSTLQQVAAHQKMAQEAERSKESVKEQETVQGTPTDEQVKLSKDGSGRGHAFLKHPKKDGEEAPEEEPEEKRQEDPGKGSRVDFTR